MLEENRLQTSCNVKPGSLLPTSVSLSVPLSSLSARARVLSFLACKVRALVSTDHREGLRINIVVFRYR